MRHCSVTTHALLSVLCLQYLVRESATCLNFVDRCPSRPFLWEQIQLLCYKLDVVPLLKTYFIQLVCSKRTGCDGRRCWDMRGLNTVD